MILFIRNTVRHCDSQYTHRTYNPKFKAHKKGLRTRALHEVSQREDISKISFRFWRENIFKIYSLFKKTEKIYILKNIFSPVEKILYFLKYLLARTKRYFFNILFFSFQKSWREDIFKIYYLFDFSKRYIEISPNFQKNANSFIKVLWTVHLYHNEMALSDFFGRPYYQKKTRLSTD